MIETSSKLPRKPTAIFDHLQKSSDIFGKCSEKSCGLRTTFRQLLEILGKSSNGSRKSSNGSGKSSNGSGKSSNGSGKSSENRHKRY